MDSVESVMDNCPLQWSRGVLLTSDRHWENTGTKRGAVITLPNLEAAPPSVHRL